MHIIYMKGTRLILRSVRGSFTGLVAMLTVLLLAAPSMVYAWNPSADPVPGPSVTVADQVSVPGPVPKTVSQFLRMSSKDTTLCLLKGVVTRIRNNETGVLFINDGTGTVLIYRMRHRDNITFRHLDVRKGDTLTVSGHRSVYDGRVIEMKYALFEEKSDGPDHDKMPVMDELDKQPSFQGKGREAFSKWISAHLVYPEDAKKAHIDGTVMVKFVIGKNGGVQEVEVVKGAYPSLNDEAVRVIKSSPKWKPGIVDGHPVRVTYTIPVIFTGDF